MNRALLLLLVRYLVERKGITHISLCRVAKPDGNTPDDLDADSESPSSGQL